MDINQLNEIITTLSLHPELTDKYINDGIVPIPLYEVPLTLLHSVGGHFLYAKERSVGLMINVEGNLSFSWTYTLYENEDSDQQVNVIMENEINGEIYKQYNTV